MNTGTDDVYELKPGLGGVVVSFFDHHGRPGVEQAAGAMIFTNYEYADENDFFFTPAEMALRIWKVQAALGAAGLMPSGRCFAFSRELEAPPIACPKDGLDEGPYLPLRLAYDDLVESRIVNEDVEAGRGDLTVSFFAHHDGSGPEQCAGSLHFPNYDARGYVTDRYAYTPREIALRMWNIERALVAAGLTPTGSCFALSREDEALPIKCPDDGLNEGPYLPIYLAYNDLIESRDVDEHGYVDISPLPYD
jgi:hypothetical protein